MINQKYRNHFFVNSYSPLRPCNTMSEFDYQANKLTICICICVSKYEIS